MLSLNDLFMERKLRRLQALGWRSGGRYLPLQDDISSAAYWYSDTLADDYPPFPSADELEII